MLCVSQANLRSLTNAQVTRYHTENYRPDNVCFILSGTAGEAEFLAAMEQIETRVLAKGGAKKGGGDARPRYVIMDRTLFKPLLLLTSRFRSLARAGRGVCPSGRWRRPTCLAS